MEMLWDDLVALSLQIISGEQDGKRAKGKAEGIAWSIARMIAPLSPDPQATVDLVREVLSDHLELLSTGADASGTVPWLHPSVNPKPGPARELRTRAGRSTSTDTAE